ncbi:MAG: hypothetical protein HKO75_02355 [Flavobacteriaceae bacterium]|nr:hypothetical protein [Muriicola sp.]NNC62399.1 hypothetical protein [Eudoraea sp.]NNK21017.1 hypothetical protein [Flavobacteriaceae bacterium]NNL38679.1 hypothetical protein [Flavobacteriaceae bacterium]
MKKLSFIFIFLLLSPLAVMSQETETDTEPQKEVDKPERATFESSYIIDNPTDVLSIKNTLEVHMAHRFGVVNSGTNDLIGIWAPANIRIALSYALHDRLTIGFGTSKFNRLQDFNWKVALLRQTRSGRIPVNVTYYGNFVIDARGKENFLVEQHRYSYFNQLIISRRFNSKLSLQGAASVSHYNLVPQRMRNDVVAMSLGGRYKVSSQTSILVDYTQPFIHHLDGAEFDMDPEAGFSVGVEFRTSSHAFQLFLSNYQGIVPQQNIMFNQNNFFEGDFLIGFNITRLYNF